MILLNELTLRRFRNHENLTIQFSPGVTGIIGKNGAGKSSIIEAISFVFTGEAYDSKEDTVTRGSSGTSFVRCRFTLNNKAGMIERALDTSRVAVEYDGLKLHKAGEIKDLWSSLLQIDNHIFNHVVVARQKQIPELFSGETMIREKAFQKIFMVPNTERLRNIIWENYLKVCPPPLPEDEIGAIDRQMAQLYADLVPKEEKLKLLSSSILSDQQMMAVVNYTDFYGRCIQDASRGPELIKKEKELVAKHNELLAQLSEVETRVKGYPQDLENKYSQLLSQQEQHGHHIFYIKELKTVLAEMNEATAGVEAVKIDIAALERELNDQTVIHGGITADITNLIMELESLRGLSSEATCPTCHQPLKDVGVHIIELQTKLSAQLTKGREVEQKLSVIIAKVKAEREAQVKKAVFAQKVRSLEEAKDRSFVQYDADELLRVEMLRCEAREGLRLLRDLQRDEVNTRADLSVIRERIAHLITYDGNSSPAEELTVMQEVLQRHRQRIQEISLLEKEVVQYRTEIQILLQRRDASMVNSEKNKRRAEYMLKLRMAYDALHTTQFPRRLVQTYSSVVEEELLQQLQRFNLPYQAHINEEFKIVITKDGHIIPRLSGGQEMIMGFCLRLALHSMFSQAFPMLIIDEGTTHLDDEHRELYFQCINDLKADKVIQQLIIIDHSPLLSGVVDNVIQL